jgi:AbrB family looped-hinge helix DNA binding protein
METVTGSSKGQIAIPKVVREALNLSVGSKLTLDLRGGEIVLSRGPAWKKLRGSSADPDLMEKFAEHRRAERAREDAGI